MIHVIASIHITKGRMSDALAVYKTFTPEVNLEQGCMMYLPTIDFETDIKTQKKDPNLITVIEKWETMDAFKAHLNADHVVKFRKNMEGIMENVEIKVLKDVQV